MHKAQTQQIKEIFARGATWVLIILFLSSSSFHLLTGLWENQEVYTLFENQGENEERNENQCPENDEDENKAEEFLLFTDFQVFLFRNLTSTFSKSGSWRYCTINPDVLTPPPKFKEFTTV